jgi:polyisoprenoid-binding protein YceI
VTITDLRNDLTATTGTWVLDPAHTHLGFSAKHAMVTTVRGKFRDFDGSFFLDGDQPANSKAELTIRAASITTDNEQRDGHLLSPDFLDVANHPTLAFTSTEVRHEGGNVFVLVGDLTIRGVTRQVELEVELQGVSRDPYGNDKIGFEATTTISRKDFGLTWNVALETGGILVSDKIKIFIDVQANKQSTD